MKKGFTPHITYPTKFLRFAQGKLCAGFTLLELLVSIGIITLIGALGLVSFINSRNSRELITSAQNVLSVLRLAQSRALAGEDSSPWGVRLEQPQFILFRGAGFAGSTSTKSYLLPSTLEIANLTLSGGGQEVVFNRLDGRTNQPGSFDVRVRGSTSQIFSVTVDSSGKVYQAGTAPAVLGTRIVDTRHRNFNLAGTIKGSLTMALTFSDPPNPDVVSSVTMTPAPPRTTFDWTGTVSVGGQNQTLRIHALSITDAGTLLSVDRDCRKNTKKVKITFDTSDLAAFEADCQTVNVFPFGGTMSEL